MSSLDFDISDDPLQESDYDDGSDSASHLLRPFIPVSPRRQQPRQRSILSDREHSSSSRYYLSNACFPCICYYKTFFLIVGPRTLVT
jgi:hypothetical protein